MQKTLEILLEFKLLKESNLPSFKNNLNLRQFL